MLYAFLFSAISATCPAHLILLEIGHSNYSWKRVQVMKLLIMQLSQTPSIYVPPLMSDTNFHTHPSVTFIFSLTLHFLCSLLSSL
jgi:hypothetical protein